MMMKFIMLFLSIHAIFGQECDDDLDMDDEYVNFVKTTAQMGRE